MTDRKDALKKTIAELKEKISKKPATNQDLELRKFRKQLRRSQRRLTLLTPVPLEDKLKRIQKFADLVGKRLSDLTKGAKKVQGNPFVHSLRKRTKSLNKQIKKINRLLEKKKKDQPAPPAQA